METTARYPTKSRSTETNLKIPNTLIYLAVAVLAAVVAITPLAVPPAGPAPGTVGSFSTARALRDLAVITAAPRVPGSAGYDAAVDYLVGEFEAMGLEPEVTEALSVRGGEGIANVGRARNVVVRIPGTDSTGAVLLAGHLDTVHTTVGASDCGGCSIAVVETARALLEGPPLRNDVILLLEDGEETTRAGSYTFATEHPLANDVKVAVNLEAMGASGSSLLYVTGPENGWLIREALGALPAPVAYSFANDLVWVTGTGGSDLDQFLLAADAGLGLAYVGDVPAYHTMRDSVATLDPRTLSHQGSSMLALARHLGNAPLDGSLRGPDIVYYNLAGHMMVRYPAGVGIGIAALAAAAAAAVLAFGLRRGELTVRGLLTGILTLVPFALAATALAGGVWALLRALDPRLQVFMIGVTYDRAWYTLAFVTLAAGAVLAGYGLLRRRSSADLSAGALIIWAGLGLLAAFALPGSSYLFALPSLMAAGALAVALFAGDERRWPRALATALAVAGTVIVYAPFVNFLGIFSGRADLLMPLPMIALLPALFVALVPGLLLPAFDGSQPRGRWLAAAALAGASILIIGGIALTARFTEDRPKPNMVAYVLNADSSEAYWVTGADRATRSRAALLDEWTSQYVNGEVEETLYSPWGAFLADSYPAYRSPAPALDLPLPEATVLADNVDAQGQRHLRLRLASPGGAATTMVRFSSGTPFVGATVEGRPVDGISPETPRDLVMMDFHAVIDDGEGIEVALTLDGDAPVSVFLEDHVYALPEVEGMDARPRPDWMMPSPTFVSDATLIRRTVTMP